MDNKPLISHAMINYHNADCTDERTSGPPSEKYKGWMYLWISFFMYSRNSIFIGGEKK